jgi:hypothetical protein
VIDLPMKGSPRRSVWADKGITCDHDVSGAAFASSRLVLVIVVHANPRLPWVDCLEKSARAYWLGLFSE